MNLLYHYLLIRVMKIIGVAYKINTLFSKSLFFDVCQY